MGTHRPDLAQLTATVIDLFPKLNEQEQRLSLHLYRLLAKGVPVSPQQIATTLELPVEVINDTLKQWWGVHYDDEDRIIAYWGLALPQSEHRFKIDGVTLYAWCAWDTLFIPELLGRTARVESSCRETKRKVRMTVAPQSMIEFDPPGTVMSLLTPEAAKVRENVICNFCQYVHFFASATAGEKWVSEHPGTFLISIEEAYALGKCNNSAQYDEARTSATAQEFAALRCNSGRLTGVPR
jgi:alkylmercury lyase